MFKLLALSATRTGYSSSSTVMFKVKRTFTYVQAKH